MLIGAAGRSVVHHGAASQFKNVIWSSGPDKILYTASKELSRNESRVISGLGSVFTELSVYTSATLFRQSYKNSQTFCFPGSADHSLSNRGHLTHWQHGRGRAQRAIQNLAYEISSAAEMHYHLLHIHAFHHPVFTSCLVEAEEENGHEHSFHELSKRLSIYKTNKNLFRLELALIFKSFVRNWGLAVKKKKRFIKADKSCQTKIYS